MNIEVWGMSIAGAAALVAGFLLAWPRLRGLSGVDKVLALGPVFAAAPLAVFGMEHLLAARDIEPIVPHWMPWPLFWTYFVGAALLAAALSFIVWRCLRWSASLLALLFIIFVATIDVPGLMQSLHNRFSWTLTLREAIFACGALMLFAGAGGLRSRLDCILAGIGRGFIAATLFFYAAEHFLFPRNAPGVPLELMTPAWMPAPKLLAYAIGVSLLLGGIGLCIRPAVRIAAAECGFILLLLTALFYVPILVTEIRSAQAVEGLNYVYDTMLFAATVLLAGFPFLEH